VLSRMVNQISVLRELLRNPLNAEQGLAMAKRWLGWHLGSRLVPGPVAVPFVNDTSLLISPGMVGATLNIYSGLAEPSDMCFVLHALRPGNIFVDVGANVGVYTILASGAVGAFSIAIEPLPKTFQQLKRNVALNNLFSLVELLNHAVGEKSEARKFTTAYDAMNHIVSTGEIVNACEVPVIRLDEALAGRVPAVMKVDVEGYELPTLRGAGKLLENRKLKAIVIELNGSGNRYGFDDIDVTRLLAASGFHPVHYDPLTRTLTKYEATNKTGNNTIFIRDFPSMEAQLKEAVSYRISTGQTL
jgi:FkbM family methyltransferase